MILNIGYGTAMEALAKASVSLRAADVTAIWYDDSYPETIRFIVETGEKLGEWRTPVFVPKDCQMADKVWLPTLPDEVKDAVKGALSGLNEPAYCFMDVSVRERYPHGGKQIWPVSALIDTLKLKVKSYEQRIAGLEKIAALG